MAVWSDGIVLFSPSLDENLRLFDRIEYLPTEQLIAQFAIEAFIVSVFPRTAGFDEGRFHPDTLQPPANRLRRELRTIIGSDILRELAISLKPGGILYTSHKYGEGELMRGGQALRGLHRAEL